MPYLLTVLKMPLYIYFISLLANPTEVIDLTAQFLTLIFTPHEALLPHISKCIVALAGFIVAYSFSGIEAIQVNFSEYQKLFRDRTLSADITVARTTTMDKPSVNQTVSSSEPLEAQPVSDERMNTENKTTPLIGDNDAEGDNHLLMHPAAQSIEINAFSATEKNGLSKDDETANTAEITTTIAAHLNDDESAYHNVNDRLSGSTSASEPTDEQSIHSRAVLTNELAHNKIIPAANQMTKDGDSADHVTPASTEKEKYTNLDKGLAKNEDVTRTLSQTLSLYAFPTPPQQPQVGGTETVLPLKKEENKNDNIDPNVSSDERSSTATTNTASSNTTNTEPVSGHSHQQQPQFLADIIEPTNGAFMSSLTENLERIMDKPLTPRISPDYNSKNNKPLLEIVPSSTVEQTEPDSNVHNNNHNNHNSSHSHQERTPSLTSQEQPSSVANSSFSRRSSTISQLSTTAASTTNKLQSALQKVVSRSGTRQSLQQQALNQVQHSSTANDKQNLLETVSDNATNEKRHRFSTIRLNKKKSVDKAEEPVSHSSDIAVHQRENPAAAAAAVIPRKSVSTRLQKGFKTTGKRISRIFS